MTNSTDPAAAHCDICPEATAARSWTEERAQHRQDMNFSGYKSGAANVCKKNTQI